MSDLVKRLCSPQYEHAGTAAPRLDAYTTVRIMKEAADRIEALEAALRFYAEPKNYSDDYWKGMWETARAALAPEQDK